jgi:putative PIN family toxin of toxin-antitoxin system
VNAPKAVIDTNVILSGLLFGGVPAKILDLGFGHVFEWYSSAPLLQELEVALSYKKFGLNFHEAKPLLEKIARIVHIVVPQIEITIIKRKPGDNRVLECAVEADCDFIVTGDRKDLLSLRVFEKIPIVTPRELLTIFNR